MKPKVRILVMALFLLSTIGISAQIKNAKSENLKIFGNCEMCKKTIETAGNQRNIAKMTWNKDTKMAHITYDTLRTNANDILKRVALAGYDSDEFLAPDDVYAGLPECCRYERVNKRVAKHPMSAMESAHAQHQHNETANNTHSHHVVVDSKNTEIMGVFNAYFSLKDALVKSDEKAAGSAAQALARAFNDVPMDQLNEKEHHAWMSVTKALSSDALHIVNAQNIEQQRTRFASLSENMYALVKVFDVNKPIYYQHCTMFDNGKGAYWLSKDKEIKNPYFGTRMLSCGKTMETVE